MICIIVEDEYPAQQVLLNYIEKTNDLNCIGVYETPNKVPFEILNQCDVIFLDIEMPEISGIEFVKSYNHSAKIVFCTAFRDYAIDAFEENITDYLLKPFSYARFLKSINRIQTTENKSLANKEIYVYADKTFHRIVLNEINFIQAQVDYINIHVNNTVILTDDSLSNWEDKYKSDDFFRIHRSFIINLKKIDKIQGNQVFIKDTAIPIGRTYQQEFFSKFNLIKK